MTNFAFSRVSGRQPGTIAAGSSKKISLLHFGKMTLVSVDRLVGGKRTVVTTLANCKRDKEARGEWVGGCMLACVSDRRRVDLLKTITTGNSGKHSISVVMQCGNTQSGVHTTTRCSEKGEPCCASPTTSDCLVENTGTHLPNFLNRNLVKQDCCELWSALHNSIRKTEHVLACNPSILHRVKPPAFFAFRFILPKGL